MNKENVNYITHKNQQFFSKFYPYKNRRLYRNHKMKYMKFNKNKAKKYQQKKKTLFVLKKL